MLLWAKFVMPGTLITRGLWSIIRLTASFLLTILLVLGARWTTPFPLIALSHLTAIQNRQLLVQSPPPCIRELQLTFIKLGVRPIGLAISESVGLEVGADLVGPVARSFRPISFYMTSNARTVSRTRTVVSRPCRSSTRPPCLLLLADRGCGVVRRRARASLAAHLRSSSVWNSRGMARTCLVGSSRRFT